MQFQVNSSLLDACVLAIVNQKDTYGYEITQEIKEKLDISESTLYPVLRRLQKEQFLETYDQEVTGRNRRYYRITTKGIMQLARYQKMWQVYVEQISDILLRSTDDE